MWLGFQEDHAIECASRWDINPTGSTSKLYRRVRRPSRSILRSRAHHLATPPPQAFQPRVLQQGAGQTLLAAIAQLRHASHPLEPKTTASINSMPESSYFSQYEYLQPTVTTTSSLNHHCSIRALTLPAPYLTHSMPTSTHQPPRTQRTSHHIHLLTQIKRPPPPIQKPTPHVLHIYAPLQAPHASRFQKHVEMI